MPELETLQGPSLIACGPGQLWHMDPSKPGPARGFPHLLALTHANNVTCFINTGGQAWILLRAQHRSEWWGRAEGLLGAPTTRAQGLSWEGAGIGALALKSSLHEGQGEVGCLAGELMGLVGPCGC